jgi:hypothetical protein
MGTPLYEPIVEEPPVDLFLVEPLCMGPIKLPPFASADFFFRSSACFFAFAARDAERRLWFRDVSFGFGFAFGFGLLRLRVGFLPILKIGHG